MKKDPTKLLQNFYNEEVERTTNSIFPEYRNVKSSLYRTRPRQLPSIPRNFRTLHIRAPWKKTLNGERFLLKNDRENGIVIFSTNEDLKILASCKNILGDGTFKSCPPPFESFMFYLGTVTAQCHSCLVCLVERVPSFTGSFFGIISERFEIWAQKTKSKIQ